MSGGAGGLQDEEVRLERCNHLPGAGQSISSEIRANLLEPLIAAARAALGEMTGAQADVQAIYCQATPHVLGDIAAVFTIASETSDFLVFGFPKQTAAALTSRIMSAVNTDVDENLIRDCVGEIANVVTGQTKALLAESPYQLGFVMPQTVVNSADFRPQTGQDGLVVVFGSEYGEFAVQLFVELRALEASRSGKQNSSQ